MSSVRSSMQTCRAINRRGDPCWAPVTLQNPLHDTLPLCWHHTAVVALAQPDGRRTLRPERVLKLVKVG